MPAARIMHSFALVFFLAASLRAATISYDEPTTELQGGPQAFSVNGTLVPALNYAETKQILVPNFQPISHIYHWGNQATGQVSGLGAISKALTGITVDGDLSNSVTVRFDAESRLDAAAADPGFGGTASTMLNYYMVFHIAGLNPGGAYSLNYDWLTEAMISEGTGGGHGYSLSAQMQPFVVGQPGPATDIINEQLLIPDVQANLGNGSINFIAPAATTDFYIGLLANTAALFGTAAGGDDFVHSVFHGEATFTIVPEPTIIFWMLAPALFYLVRKPIQPGAKQ